MCSIGICSKIFVKFLFHYRNHDFRDVAIISRAALYGNPRTTFYTFGQFLIHYLDTTLCSFGHLWAPFGTFGQLRTPLDTIEHDWGHHWTPLDAIGHIFSSWGIFLYLSVPIGTISLLYWYLPAPLLVLSVTIGTYTYLRLSVPFGTFLHLRLFRHLSTAIYTSGQLLTPLTNFCHLSVPFSTFRYLRAPFGKFT
jgi:hypothetical protein